MLTLRRKTPSTRPRVMLRPGQFSSRTAEARWHGACTSASNMTVPSEAPGDALSSVAESTLALARAEVRLAVAEAKEWLIRVGRGLGLLWLGLLLAQVFVLLAALSPIFFSVWPSPVVVAALAISLAAALGTFGLAFHELRKV